MKMLIQAAAALVVVLSVGQAFADTNCNDHAYQRTRDYAENNEAQALAIDVLRAVYYVECKSTYQEMATQLADAQQKALDAYEVAGVYAQVSSPVHRSFVSLANSLDNLQARLNTISKTAEAQNSAMRLRMSITRVRGLVGY